MADAQGMLTGALLPAARLSVPDDVAALLVEQGRTLGADGVSVYLVDHEQHVLVPLPQTNVDQLPPHNPRLKTDTGTVRILRA